MSNAIAIESARRHAETLIELMVDHGPSTSAEICQRLGWTKGRFSTALKTAREDVCPALEVTIPHPTPDNGWRYEVTTEWQTIEAGAAHSLGNVESRLRSIHRDVATVLPMLNPRSKEGRRANFLNKHLAHILGTLEEISNG